jgi:hypothetical protein
MRSFARFRTKPGVDPISVSVYNKADGVVNGRCKEALYQHTTSGHMCAVIVIRRVYAVECITAKIGASRKLRKRKT